MKMLIANTKGRWVCLAAFFMLVASSCEVLRITPFMIVSWSPGPGRHLVTDDIMLQVEFSEEPDRASAENSFSLSENGAALSGQFSWQGSALTFLPYGGLRPNAEYRMTVSADARNEAGVSLEKHFEVSFSSSPEAIRPRVVSTFPERDGRLETVSDVVRIVFSESLDAVSLRECISFSPSIKGIWNMEPDGCMAIFTPLEPWAWDEDYNAAISAELIDCSGNRIGEPYAFRFSIGADHEPPVLLRAEAVDTDGLPVLAVHADDPQDGVVQENPGWEAAWKLRLHYSEPVSWQTLSSRIAGEGGVNPEAVWDGDDTRYVDIRMDGYPEWGEDFLVRIPQGVEDESGNTSLFESVFKFKFNGPVSRPPRFVGIRLLLAPGEELPANRGLAVFSVDQPYATIAMTGAPTGYPVGVPVATSLEVYVELAAGAELDVFSLMKSFRFSSTNGSVDFTANRMLIGGLAYCEPHGPWANYAVARVDGTLTNRVDSGILTVQLAAGFCDSFGNASSATQRLTMLK